MTGQVPQTSRRVAQAPFSSRRIARMKKMRMRSPSCFPGAATLTFTLPLAEGIAQFKARDGGKRIVHGIG